MSDLFDNTANRKKINPLGLKADDIRKAMANRWTDPEWAIMWEVGEGTGMNSGRYADAVMMSLWPSRGLELHGVEIKISRSDWKREAADPRKAEAIAKYCDRWWIHTPENVVDDLSDLPPAWGLREWTGKRWNTKREAQKTEALPVPRSFLAAMLRRADGAMRAMMDAARGEAYASIEADREEWRKRRQDEISKEVKRRTEKLERAAENLAKFEAAFGEGSAWSWNFDHEALGRAAFALSKINDNGWSPLAKRLRAAADEIDALNDLVGGDRS